MVQQYAPHVDGFAGFVHWFVSADKGEKPLLAAEGFGGDRWAFRRLFRFVRLLADQGSLPESAADNQTQGK